jgi:predicted RNA-binding Zn-ribbon protein involved in translation (DUF1610 family)
LKIKENEVKEMMMKKLENKGPAYTIDLAAVEGDGSFECPKCGVTISPDDETEQTYKIEDTKVVNGELAELVITCGKCRSTIELTGFQQGL